MKHGDVVKFVWGGEYIYPITYYIKVDRIADDCIYAIKWTFINPDGSFNDKKITGMFPFKHCFECKVVRNLKKYNLG